MEAYPLIFLILVSFCFGIQIRYTACVDAIFAELCFGQARAMCEFVPLGFGSSCLPAVLSKYSREEKIDLFRYFRNA